MELSLLLQESPAEVGLIGEKAAQPINSRQLSNNLETLLPTVQCSFFADAISPTSTGDSCNSRLRKNSHHVMAVFKTCLAQILQHHKEFEAVLLFNITLYE